MAEVDQLGPVDWLVIEFPNKQPTGQIAPHLKESGRPRLGTGARPMVLQKDTDGTLNVMELSDLDPSDLGEIRTTEAELAMVLSEQDVVDLAETHRARSTAAVLVWENVWAAPFGSAVREAGGQLVASGRIPIQAGLAAIEADAEGGV